MVGSTAQSSRKLRHGCDPFFGRGYQAHEKNIVLQNKYGGECQISVVAVLFPAMSGFHSGFSPLKNSILVGFYSYFSGDQSGIIYHPFLLRYFGGGRCRYGKLLFTC